MYLQKNETDEKITFLSNQNIWGTLLWYLMTPWLAKVINISFFKVLIIIMYSKRSGKYPIVYRKHLNTLFNTQRKYCSS